MTLSNTHTNKAATPGHSDVADPYVRILRWMFSRDTQRVSCELGLTGTDSAYRLRVVRSPSDRPASVEFFDDALAAFQRHAMIERTLLNEGWALEGFNSEPITRH